MSTTLTIRNLDESVKHLLRIQAARHGRSMEAEARDILAGAFKPVAVSPPQVAAKKHPKSTCTAVRGMWAGRMSTDEVMALTRGE